MNKPDDAYIRIHFPDGSVFLIRTDTSGVVLDDANKPKFPEDAPDMLTLKCCRLIRREALGRA
ncbi:MAG: hypothetical protein ACRELF_15730 [Gemmataceae bacterium]